MPCRASLPLSLSAEVAQLMFGSNLVRFFFLFFFLLIFLFFFLLFFSFFFSFFFLLFFLFFLLWLFFFLFRAALSSTAYGCIEVEAALAARCSTSASRDASQCLACVASQPLLNLLLERCLWVPLKARKPQEKPGTQPRKFHGIYRVLDRSPFSLRFCSLFQKYFKRVQPKKGAGWLTCWKGHLEGHTWVYETLNSP